MTFVIGIVLCFAPHLTAGSQDRLFPKSGEARTASQIFYEQNFDRLEGSLGDGEKRNGFWFEGADHGASAQFANQRLEIHADGGKVGTVWLDRAFEGNVKIECDAQVLASKRQ